jgi:hypothetical protein
MTTLTRASNASGFARRIPQTFECRATQPELPADVLPDELMIDWVGVPAGATAAFFLPAASSDEIVEQAGRLYGGQRVTRVDPYTVRTDATGVTYLPIPTAAAGNLAGLLTLELPAGSPTGARYQAIVRQLSTSTSSPLAADAAAVRAPVRGDRHVIGAFQLSVPIVPADELLPSDERSLAFFRWVLTTIASTDRWYPVIGRFIRELELRVSDLGGDPARIAPSPTGSVGHHPPPLHPAPHPQPGHGTLAEQTGKIDELLFDRFGDFEGFVLKTDSGPIERYYSRDPGLAELAVWAWQSRLRTTVISEPAHPHQPIRIHLHA